MANLTFEGVVIESTVLRCLDGGSEVRIKVNVEQGEERSVRLSWAGFRVNVGERVRVTSSHKLEIMNTGGEVIFCWMRA